jgi:hypothetical protein
MKSNLHSKQQIAVLLFCTFVWLVLSGCNKVEIKNPSIMGVTMPEKAAPGERVTIKVEVNPGPYEAASLRYKWNATDGGGFERPETHGQPQNVYLAPVQPTNANVNIEITVLHGEERVDFVQKKISVSGTPPGAPPLQSRQPLAGAGAESVEVNDLFYASGFMGDAAPLEKDKLSEYVQLDDASRENPHSPPTCYKFTIKPGPLGWSAVGWQYPDGNFGSKPGRNLTTFAKVSVWLRSSKPGYLLLKAGGHTEPGANYPASFESSPIKVKISAEWARAEIPIRDATNVPCVFVWVSRNSDNPEPFDLWIDDLRLEK